VSILDDDIDVGSIDYSTLDPQRQSVVRDRLLKLQAEARRKKENALSILNAIARENQRRRWLANPDLWAVERMHVHLWSKQIELMQAVGANRKTAAVSCHDVGKSFSAALTCAWWLDVHPPGSAFVVTSAPTAPQVKAILWREIGKLHAHGKLPGRVNTTEWHMTSANGNEELVAFGRKPDDYEPTAFQGIHARFVLVVFDEACGMAMPLWEAADSIIANDDSKFLAIGNPDDPNTEFKSICEPGSGWALVTIGAFDSPNFTGEPVPDFVSKVLIGKRYVEDKRRKWAPNWYWADAHGNQVDVDRGVAVVPPIGADAQDTNPVWQSKILGRFPKQSAPDSLIPIEWIRLAQERTIVPHGEKVLGVDVGGGGDSSTGCLRHGDVFRILWEDHNPDTMHTCGVAVKARRTTGASRVQVDIIGIGRGVTDRGKELHEPFIGINVGESPDEQAEKLADEQFANLRAQYWWGVRERFEQGRIDIDPLDDDLAAELSAIKFKRVSSGKIQIESKIDMKRRGQPSPNRADALMLAHASPRMIKGGVLAGRSTW
jgi:hypothetical protein